MHRRTNDKGVFFAVSTPIQIIAFLWSARLAHCAVQADLRLFIKSSPLDASTNVRAKHPKTNMKVLLRPISNLMHSQRSQVRRTVVNSKSGNVHANAFLEMNLYVCRISENTMYTENIYIFKTPARLLSSAADDDNQRRHQLQSSFWEQNWAAWEKERAVKWLHQQQISNIKFSFSCGLFNLFSNFPPRCRESAARRNLILTLQSQLIFCFFAILNIYIHNPTQDIGFSNRHFVEKLIHDFWTIRF